MSEEFWSLDELARAHGLQDWMFSLLRPSEPGPMLEVGAGIGTFSGRLLDAGADPLVLLEPETELAGRLESSFGDDARVQIVRELLPESPTLRARPSSFRYALAQNVIEHIEDDAAAVASIVAALEPGGELAVLVPANPWLYGRLDRRFGHHRRYTRETLTRVLEEAGAELVSLRSFNFLGIPGWLLASRLPALDITHGSLRVYEALLRAWRPVETVLRPPVGLSLVARARRPC